MLVFSNAIFSGMGQLHGHNTAILVNYRSNLR